MALSRMAKFEAFAPARSRSLSRAKSSASYQFNMLVAGAGDLGVEVVDEPQAVGPAQAGAGNIAPVDGINRPTYPTPPFGPEIPG